MIPRFGIDTSILVRLLTGDPEEEFQHCVKELSSLIEEENAEILASNQVIGEAYIAVQHHYGVAKQAARDGLVQVLRSGLVAPLNGGAVIAALEDAVGCGLLDRLIADDYRRAGLTPLTLDRKMASLPDARRLRSFFTRRRWPFEPPSTPLLAPSGVPGFKTLRRYNAVSAWERREGTSSTFWADGNPGLRRLLASRCPLPHRRLR